MLHYSGKNLSSASKALFTLSAKTVITDAVPSQGVFESPISSKPPKFSSDKSFKESQLNHTNTLLAEKLLDGD